MVLWHMHTHRERETTDTKENCVHVALFIRQFSSVYLIFFILFKPILQRHEVSPYKITITGAQKKCIISFPLLFVFCCRCQCGCCCKWVWQVSQVQGEQIQETRVCNWCMSVVLYSFRPTRWESVVCRPYDDDNDDQPVGMVSISYACISHIECGKQIKLRYLTCTWLWLWIWLWLWLWKFTLTLALAGACVSSNMLQSANVVVVVIIIIDWLRLMLLPLI